MNDFYLEERREASEAAAFDAWYLELKAIAEKSGCLWLLGDDKDGCYDLFFDDNTPKRHGTKLLVVPCPLAANRRRN